MSSERFDGTIHSGRPNLNFEGIKDNSRRELPPKEAKLPICCWLFFTFAEKGPSKPVFCSPDLARKVYGEKTFDMGSKFATTQTEFFLKPLRQSKALGCMVHRLVPDDARTSKANISLWYDILYTDIPNYKRTLSGAYHIDPETKTFVVDENEPTVKGFKVKIIAEEMEGVMDKHEYGTLVPKQGTMRVKIKDIEGNVKTETSTMYPIVEVVAPYFGAAYNLTGFAITPLKGRGLDKNYLTHNRSLVYEFSLYSKDTEFTTPEVLRTIFDETSAKFSLREGSVNPSIQSQSVDFESIFPNRWVNKDLNGKKYQPDIFDDFYYYKNNIENISKMIYLNELKHIYNREKVKDGTMDLSWYDFTVKSTSDLLDNKVVSEHFLLDIFNLKSLTDVPYKTAMIAPELPILTPLQKEVSLSPKSPVFLRGGKDGTLTPEVFEELIRRTMKEYGDGDSVLNNLSTNLSNTIIDTGFSLETKLSLCNFLAHRPHSMVHYSTCIKGKNLGLSDQVALANALATQLSLFPESTIHNTDVCRSTISIGDFRFFGETKRNNRTPLSFEVGFNILKMFGTEKFLMENRFDGGKNAELKLGTEYYPAEIKESIKDVLWGNCINWAEPKTSSLYSIPSIQTVYGDETSVLKNVYGLYAAIKCMQVAIVVHNEVKGSARPAEEFRTKVESELQKRLEGAFGTIVTVSYEVYYTAFDKASGYSYHVLFKIQAPNARNVGVVGIDMNRFDQDDSIETKER